MIVLNVSFYTLGCKVNQFETDAMIQLFSDEGFEISEPSDKSDIFVVNSCTVTNASDKKTRNIINRFKRLNPKSIIVLAGCYAQAKKESLKETDNIDIIIGTKHKDKVVSFVNEYIESNNFLYKVDEFISNEEYEEMTISHATERTRANIKIQDGCRQFCSYCIIPFVRGPLRSRAIEDIISEIIKLKNNGYKEIVLNGIHITSYGTDLDGIKLINLIRSINELNIKDIRYRLGSLEPGIIERDLIIELNKGNFCDHFHLSLQSGSNTVLKRMNRKYTKEDFLEKVELIRKYMPNASITTDIIVGFPGETETEFLETCDFVKKVNFSKVHVFPFSPREGTLAYNMNPQVNGVLKKERSNALISLSEALANEYYNKFIDSELEILYENYNDEGYYSGHSSNYLTVYSKSNFNLHNVKKKVRITECRNNILYSEEVII